MQQLVAQSIIAEMVTEYNTLAEYRAGLVCGACNPWNEREDALAQATQAAYKHAAHIVARQAGIKLVWHSSD